LQKADDLFNQQFRLFRRSWKLLCAIYAGFPEKIWPKKPFPGENSVGPRSENVRDNGKITNRNRSQKNTRSISTYKNHLATSFNNFANESKIAAVRKYRNMKPIGSASNPV
jgi:hypothetical protein